MPNRVTKPRTKKLPLLDRRSSSTFKSLARKKPSQSGSSQPTPEDDYDDEFAGRLEDRGLVKMLASDLSLRDVVPTMNHILSTMFDDVPTERSGMNSTRTAEVLNFRKTLPPLVTNAHVHSLVNSPTSVEKEISKLASAGLIKRISVPGRGSGASSISDGLVLVKDWAQVVESMHGLSTAVKSKYITYLKSNSQSTIKLRGDLSDEETTSLMRVGLLTAATSSARAASNVLTSRSGTAGTLTSIHSISRAASGSLDAIGGQGAVLGSGGGGSRYGASTSVSGGEVRASLPNTGAFLKLIETARSHLLTLLSKSKYKEAPLYLLRERWDGNVSTQKPYGRSKDPFSLVLPGKTRKWKDFYGLKFDWVLAECLGGGLVEVFETGSVGLGVRHV